MNFIHTPFLLLLIVVPILALFLILRGRARARGLSRIGDTELVNALLSQVSFARRRWKALLWLVTLTLLIVAVARPAWGIELQKIEKEGAAVIIVLDVSRSMDAQDVLPSRLERAKLDLRDLFAGLEGSDAGIILFAGQAVKFMPLTYDMEAAQIYIGAVSSSAISVQGTAIAEALKLAVESFDERITGQPVIVLISDGENHEGDTQEAAREAAELGIVIHTLGYGTTAGATVPVFDEAGNIIDYKTDANGELVQSKLDETVLQKIADLTGGIYQPHDGGGLAMRRLLETVNLTRAGSPGEEFIARPVERFEIFVALALLLLSLEMLLSEARREAA
jgi:Ca-activated chloride channel family protein